MLKRLLEEVCHCPESASQTPRMAVVMQRACSGLLQFIMVMGHGHGVRETPGQRAESVKFVDGVVIHSDDPQ